MVLSCTIGAMSNLVQRRRAEWRRQAMRQLRELRELAEDLGNRLDDDRELHLGDVLDEANQLHSFVLSFITFTDRDRGLTEAGIE